MLIINNQAHLTEEETDILHALLQDFITKANYSIAIGAHLTGLEKHMIDEGKRMLEKLNERSD